MPIQAPQWTEFLNCPICYNEFNEHLRRPISLGCGHSVCKSCLCKLQRKQCPFDQTPIGLDIERLPVNGALLQLVGVSAPTDADTIAQLKGVHGAGDQLDSYLPAKKCIEDLALYLKPFSHTNSTSSSSVSNSSGNGSGALSRPMQRKLVTLIHCQLVEDEGRSRAMRAARSLGERTVTELILQHQNPQQLSTNLWAAVRARGCQFLGPAMQEEVLKLVLLALEDGSALSRKVLVMFVVQRLEPHFPQASKTSIGHVVQLLYRASCFKVSKRDGDSSLMQLKEEFRTYEALRREHDAQIVQIATEAGLRIAPDQWSSLLYGDTAHKSHMQSIIDKLQTPQSFAQSVQELVIALQRTSDPGNLSCLRHHLELLAAVDPSPDAPSPTWDECRDAMHAISDVVQGLVDFIQNHGSRKLHDGSHTFNSKYKTSLCRDLSQRGGCPRGANCTFAHSEDEMERYRAKNRKSCSKSVGVGKGVDGELGMLLLKDGVADSLSTSSKTQPSQHTVNNGSVYPGVQADDLLYSSSTPTLTRAPHSGHMFREGFSTSYPAHPGQLGQQQPQQQQKTLHLQTSLTAMHRPHPITVSRVGAPYTLNPESPVYQPYNSGTNPFAAARQPLYSPGVQHVFTGNPIVYPELYGASSSYDATTLGGTGGSVTYVAASVQDETRSHQVPQQGNSQVTSASSQAKSTTVVSTATWESHPRGVVSGGQVVSSATRDACNQIQNQNMSTVQSLAALHQRKKEILSQLERIQRDPRRSDDLRVYNNASRADGERQQKQQQPQHHTMSLPATKMSDTAPVISTAGENDGIPQTYSHWTTDCILSTGFNYPTKTRVTDSSASSNTAETTRVYVGPSEDDQFIPFDPPVVSKYGPISRVAKTILRSTNPIQVNSSCGGSTVSTCIVRKPLPVASPLPTWYNNGAIIGYPAQGGPPIVAQEPESGGFVGNVSGGTGDATNETAPLYTVRENVQVCEAEKMKIELRNLECQINTLQLAAEVKRRGVAAAVGDGEKLALELCAVEHGIREKEKELIMNTGMESLVDWKPESRLKMTMANGKTDEEEYELQVAHDMEEAEQRWLFELEQDEQEWTEQRASGKGVSGNTIASSTSVTPTVAGTTTSVAGNRLLVDGGNKRQADVQCH